MLIDFIIIYLKNFILYYNRPNYITPKIINLKNTI